MSALILGVINIAIVVAVLILVGLLIVWFMNLLGMGGPPDELRKIYMVIVGLIALYMLVALFLGLPSFAVLPFRA